MRSSLKIGIDGRMLGPRLKGIGRYIWELCKGLDVVLSEAQFFVYSRAPIDPIPFISARWSWRYDGSALGRRIPNSIWCVSRLGYLAARDHVDVFWAGTGLLPLCGPKLRTVLTVYDLVYKLAPHTTSARARWAMRIFFGASVRHADQLVSISSGTAQRLKATHARSAAAIVHPGITETVRPRPNAEVARLLRRSGIQQPYLLSVGTLEPRKGLQRLVPAFLSLLQEGQLTNYRLVLVGERGWKDDAINRLICSSDAIMHLGFVDDEMLSVLYTGADAFIFPSSYEGFGMPVLEARACGTRVVATDLPEVREAGGCDTVYIPPTIEGIRVGILRALSRDRPPPLNCSEYSWLRSARTLGCLLCPETATAAD